MCARGAAISTADDASSAAPAIAQPVPLGSPPVLVPGPGAPKAVVTAATGAFALAPAQERVVVPIATAGFWAATRTGPPQPTLARVIADPPLPRTEGPLVLEPGELVRFHVPFVPRTVGLSHGAVRPGWFEPGWFGETPFIWRVPSRIRGGRATFEATDQVGNRLTYSFGFSVRQR